MSLPVTILYAGLFGLFALILSFFAGSARGKSGESILFGDPVNMDLAQRVRIHQNFLEYVPLILIIMAAIELNGASSSFLHIIGVLLIISRFAHAIGLKHDNMGHPGRLVGAGGTALIKLVVSGYAVWLGVNNLLG